MGKLYRFDSQSQFEAVKALHEPAVTGAFTRPGFYHVNFRTVEDQLGLTLERADNFLVREHVHEALAVLQLVADALDIDLAWMTAGTPLHLGSEDRGQDE